MKIGWPLRKRRLAATIGFLIVFLPVFWDWLPTLWLHSYYCAAYSGLTVAQTPEQWRKENPGVAGTLTRHKPAPQVGAWPRFYLQLNERFRWEIESIEKPLGLRQNENRVVDSKTGKVLVRLVDFSTGRRPLHGEAESLRDYKFWLHRSSCRTQSPTLGQKDFGALTREYEAVGGR